MNRIEIKNLAKEKIKDNKWKLWKPLLIMSLIAFCVEFVGGFIDGFNGVDPSDSITIGSVIIDIGGIAIGIFGAGYWVYLLKFVRTGNAEFSDVVECFKQKWVKILCTLILMSVFVFLWSLLLVVPGIIAALAYSFAIVLVVDEDLEAKEAIKKSKEMMKGHKWDYFVFGLSFIGWILLVPFTLGILLVWLIPYMNVAQTLYYEKLKELKK